MLPSVAGTSAKPMRNNGSQAMAGTCEVSADLAWNASSYSGAIGNAREGMQRGALSESRGKLQRTSRALQAGACRAQS